MRAIIATARAAPNVAIWDDTFTTDLLTNAGVCVGAVVSHPAHGTLLIWAKQVVLAAGGCGMVYRETTNPPVATGDGLAAAYRAGAELRDMEFMQFHPTVLYVAGSARSLVSEAVRGEGAYLRDVNGDRFMLTEDPRLELAPRDVVARAIFRTMERTRHPNVYLDLSHLDPAMVRTRFPGIARVCRGFGLEITTDRIPVRPGAHYMIGGVAVDHGGRTTLPGLWAAGEVTSSLLHGANRLASNSLIEGLVYGARCGRGAGEAARGVSDDRTAFPLRHRFPSEDTDARLDVTDLMNSLRTLMVRKMGIVRERGRLLEARGDVGFWCRYALGRGFPGKAGWELQNLLTVGRLMIDAALTRDESRGHALPQRPPGPRRRPLGPAARHRPAADRPVTANRANASVTRVPASSGVRPNAISPSRCPPITNNPPSRTAVVRNKSAIANAISGVPASAVGSVVGTRSKRCSHIPR